jgi:hypothetical protein
MKYPYDYLLLLSHRFFASVAAGDAQCDSEDGVVCLGVRYMYMQYGPERAVAALRFIVQGRLHAERSRDLGDTSEDPGRGRFD